MQSKQVGDDSSPNNRSKAVTSGLYTNTSMDNTLTNTKRKILQRRSKRMGSNGLDEDRNCLLDDNTLPYLFSDNQKKEQEEEDSSEAISNASLLFENSHTRWYHRCFKCNIALNIAMLITFIFIILFAPWYAIEYSPSKDVKLRALFSLLMISFTRKNASTGQNGYYRIFSVTFFRVCRECDVQDPQYESECE